MPSSVTINGSSYNVPETNDTLWGDYTTNLLLALSANSNKDFNKAIFVSKSGSNSNAGLTPAKALLTLQAGINLAESISIGASDPIAVIVLDSGTYTENLSFGSSGVCYLIAPNATLEGKITCTGYSGIIKLYSIVQTGAAATAFQMQLSGEVFLDVNYISQPSGAGIGIDVDNGVCNANIGRIAATGSSYDIASGATLNMFINQMSGTETNAGTSNITIAGNPSMLASNGTRWYWKVDNDGVAYTEDTP